MSDAIVNDSEIHNEKQSKSNLTLFLILATLVAPMLLAYVFFQNQVLLPEKTSNQGELIHPPFSMKNVLSETNAFHRKEWVILNFLDSNRSYDYLSLLNETKNVHIRLGKDAYRVQRLLLSNHDVNDEELLTYFKSDAYLSILPRISNQLLTSPMTDYHTIIIDPNGYAILGYNREHSASHLLKDIKRLLKFSYEQYNRG